jgi:DnaJ-domain-containing protein 1
MQVSGCRHLLEDEHAKIRSEYENRFRDLERQRTAVEGDRAQARPLATLRQRSSAVSTILSAAMRAKYQHAQSNTGC